MTQEEKDVFYMNKAIAEAKIAFEKDEVPLHFWFDVVCAL